MSVTRSPRLNELRRRETIADAKRTSAIIAILCAVAAFGFVGSILIMGWR